MWYLFEQFSIVFNQTKTNIFILKVEVKTSENNREEAGTRFHLFKNFRHSTIVI